VTWWRVTGVASGIIRDVQKLVYLCHLGFVVLVRVKDQEKYLTNFSKKQKAIYFNITVFPRLAFLFCT